MNLQVATGLGLALVLLIGALAKLAAPRRSAAALTTFGLRARGVTLAVLVVTELGLAAAVADGRAAAAYAAAGLTAAFGLALAVVLRRGGAGKPCGCFGARGTVSPAAVARNAVLAGAFAGLPSIPRLAVSTMTWLAAGVGLALAGLVGAAVAILALARELGELRLRVGPQLALELEHEGPPLGERILGGRFDPPDDTGLVLAVFSSAGCPLCRALEPSLAWLASDPFVSMLSFDEHADADVWEALGVPGSPYAVVLDRLGTVLAKGAFNNTGQLEGMLASAERRAEAAHA